MMSRSLGRAFIFLLIAWTLFLIALTWFETMEIRNSNRQDLLYQARSFAELVMVARRWNTSHQGVYVPITEKTPPNPYLNLADREIPKPDGQMLTLMNPAYMTRQMSEMSYNSSEVSFNLTSLKPIRPENAPAEWEAALLREISSDRKEAFSWQSGEGESGRSFFRYMSSVWVEEGCLKCHGDQGYRVGELRGGISVSIPTDEVVAGERKEILFAWGSYFLVWLCGFLGSILALHLLKKGARRQEKLISELSESLAEIKTLRGLLPICASCKKIRDDQGAWNAVESYVRDHSEAEFSHGICPECVKKLYPDLAENILKRSDGGEG